LVNPSGVAVAPDGTLVVADPDAFDGGGGLIRVDPDTGQQTKVAASTVFSKPFGVAVEADGMIVVAYSQRSPGFGDVLRVNPGNGEHRRVAPEGRFFTPFFVTVERTGDVIVVEIDPGGSGMNSRIHRVSKATGAQRTLAEEQPPGAIFGGVATEPSGNLVLTNLPNHAEPELVRFNPTTGVHAVVARGGSLVSPFGVAVGTDGSILVADQVNGVLRVDPVTGAQSTLSSGGNFVFPFGLAVAR
jgi:streptogramin lyase